MRREKKTEQNRERSPEKQMTMFGLGLFLGFVVGFVWFCFVFQNLKCFYGSRSHGLFAYSSLLSEIAPQPCY